MGRKKTHSVSVSDDGMTLRITQNGQCMDLSGADRLAVVLAIQTAPSIPGEATDLDVLHDTVEELSDTFEEFQRDNKVVRDSHDSDLEDLSNEIRVLENKLDLHKSILDRVCRSLGIPLLCTKKPAKKKTRRR